MILLLATLLLLLSCHIVAGPYLTDTIGQQNVALADSHKIKFNHGGTGPFTYKVLRNGQVIPESDKRVRLTGYDNSAKLSFAGQYLRYKCA